MSNKGQIGQKRPAERSRNTWVQTERKAHERWAKLIREAPMAASLAHVLVANMGEGNAVVASQRTLGELLALEVTKNRDDDSEALRKPKPVHRNTVRQAIKKLEKEQFVEVVELGGKGGALAYVVNARVAWHGSRNDIRYARFNAEVLASESEQSESVDERKDNLVKIPTLAPGEEAMPTGPGEDPPSQTEMHDLVPVVWRDADGRVYEPDPETGELQQRVER